MKTRFMTMLTMGLAIALFPGQTPAAPDQFIGDAAIYGGQSAAVEPNVLIIIDNSGSMSQAANPGAVGQPYNPATNYTQTANCTDTSGPNNLCATNTVYNASGGNSIFLNNVSSVATTCTWTVAAQNDTTRQPQNLLLTTGQYNGPKLNSDGSCCYQSVKIQTGGTKKSPIYTTYPNGKCGNATYELGNYINWLYDSPSASMAKLTIAKSVMGTLIQSTAGVRFGVMTYFYNPSPAGGTFRVGTNIGGTGLSYTSTIQEMDAAFSGTLLNRDALAETVNQITTSGATPIGGTLFEAMRYFQGGQPAFGATVGATGPGTTYISPIQYTCQKNYVVFITDGMTNSDTQAVLGTLCNNGDCDGDGMEPNTNWPPPGVCDIGTCSGPYNHIADDVAKYTYEHDLLSGLPSTTQNNVTTFTIGFGDVSANATAVAFLKRIADSSHGRGQYYSANSAQTLSQALTSILSQIYAVNSAFVAPVVPLNPENKIYTGNRVYMGFFKPSDTGSWLGNVKKYGLGCDCVRDLNCKVCNPLTLADQNLNVNAKYGNFNVIDKNGRYATYAAANNPKVDDRDGATLPLGASDGSFRSTSWSYWSTTADSGEVDIGGAGGTLMTRPNSIATTTSGVSGVSPRKIYTYMGTKTALTDVSNKFDASNASLTPAKLGLPGAIILTGTTADAQTLINYVQGFDVFDANGNGNFTEKRQWIMGDVLHSRPAVVEYAKFSPANEANCSLNQNVIFVGTNDGMLHAINDCDGSEAWAFIPPDLLPNLQYLVGPLHTYFVDSSARSFTTVGGKTILVVGLRRGGGVTASPITGFYYALDVTIPTAPIYLWTISNATAGFSDLGEAWSEPQAGQIMSGSRTALFFGGGYDNCNEDGRYGATQTFSGACVGSASTNDGGNVTSGGTTAVSSLTAANYKGRAVYVIDITTGSLIWSYTQASTPPLEYAIASELKLIDLNKDGFIDIVYVGDVGGNVWRFDIRSTDTTKWKAAKIFKSNPGYSGYPTSVADGSTGRKIFYKFAAMIEVNGVVRLFFGTGDREHPLNEGIVDRLYGLVDKGQASAVTEYNLVDMSAGQAALTNPQATQLLADVASAIDTANTRWYGWYLRLNQNAGEKNLSAAALFNSVATFTTYSPNATSGTDICTAGNLGTGWVYDAWYSNGGIVPTTGGVPDPGRVKPPTGTKIGSGIPSGAVIVGDHELISSGGGIIDRQARKGGTVKQLFTREK